MQTNPSELLLQSMRVSIEHARRVRGNDDGPWTVGVRDDRGELVGSAMLESRAQVKAFAQAMEDLGFVHAVLQRQENLQCCDYSFRLGQAQLQRA